MDHAHRSRTAGEPAAPTDAVDIAAIRKALKHAGWMARYFRFQIKDAGRIPTTGPALLVLNHGFLPVDAVLLGAALHDSHRRLPRALMDRLFSRMPVLRETLLAFGAVEGRPDLGEALLREGNLVMVFPGGAKEAFKSTARRYRLLWDDRVGFARLAIRCGVPVVPVACIGIDDLYLVFNDGYEDGRRLFGIKSLPFPLAMGLGPLPFPVRLTSWVGEPILADAPPEAADDPEVLAAFRDRVRLHMEALIEGGLRERRSLL